MNAKNENTMPVQHEKIAGLAKQMWENEGRQAGRDLEYWLRAEKQLLSGRARARTGQPPPERRAIKLPDSIKEPAHS